MALTKVRGSGIDADGQEVILDADADTTITADTDDRIDFKTAGSDRMKINSNGSVGIASDVTTSDLNIGAGVGSYATIQMTPGGTSTGNIIYFGDSSDADYSSITSFGSGAGENGRMRFIVGTQESLNILNNGNMATHGTNDIIKTNGFLKVSNAFAFHGSTSNYSNVDGQQFHELNSSQNNEFVVMMKTTGTGTTQQGLYFDHTSNTNNTSSHFIQAYGGGALRFEVHGNGDVTSATNSYGSTSDERLKTDIVDANSQWEDIKAVRIRNFKKFNNEFSQIGVIAQELEKVSPKLVDELTPEKDEIKYNSEFGTLYTSDDAETKPILYEKGDDIPDGSKIGDVKTPASKVVGEVKERKEMVKGVKYSVLYMKAIKALQEAMERIETLEAKVKTLEEA